jgi:hypothetical protein
VCKLAAVLKAKEMDLLFRMLKRGKRELAYWDQGEKYLIICREKRSLSKEVKVSLRAT